MSKGPYKGKKRGAGRHVQLPEYLQATAAWRDLKPGPRALYIELKRRFNGRNNGRLILSHREAAKALNCHRNTVCVWFKELETHGFISMMQSPHLGPSGVGLAALWALQEIPVDGAPATMGFRKWKRPESPHKNCDSAA
ncbi:hypothetical protein [Rhodalgimonas zhirmunskyi]|uniref:Helix-turn-helix domain-containing protein n=1 Tax=Rhodalgimonas zhirmunskyi TaxID=2964767 RepID=A0AAJ1UE08_9RHOB|nr:hypothetical protein [Rhodoalgimonas zhirmunskyi]MDQ2094287.1 hypothetical protein [Rhodoalgimonas zhirmunskyi]